MQEGEHRTLKNERFFYQQPRIKVSSLYLARFFFLILGDYMVVNRKRPYLAFETVQQQLEIFFNPNRSRAIFKGKRGVSISKLASLASLHSPLLLSSRLVSPRLQN